MNVRHRSLVIPAAALLALACGGGRERVDILITGGTVISMDSTRRVLDDAAVAILADRIVAVGPTAELTARYRGAEIIDARRKIVMPGLIDGHGHAGHGLVKALGTDTQEWNSATERIYSEVPDPAFWRAEALLTGVERVRFGVTTALSFFGGGDMIMRTDHPQYGDAYLGAIDQVGIRFFLAVGPRRPPFPHQYAQLVNDSVRTVPISFERHLEVSEDLIQRWHGAGDGRIHLAVMFPTHDPAQRPTQGAELAELTRQAQAMRALSRRYGLRFTQDGHTRGTVKFAHEQWDLLGPDAILSHATEFTDEEIQILARTNTRIVSNPSAIAAIRGRSPVTELIDAGVTVMIGSDGVAPDRSYDMFRHMFQATRYHRRHFRDPDVLPAGKTLEMVTIDAARALGLEHEIGSLEVGKKADIILVDAWRPHLVPLNMPVHRIVYFANGNDVSTVLVNGRVLMRDRVVLSVNEAEVLTLAQRQAEIAIGMTQLDSLTRLPAGFWGKSRLTR